MAVKKHILILFIIIGAATAFSCKKNTEQDIIGTWNRMLVQDANAEYTEDWIFDGEKIYIVQTRNGVSDTVDQGNYLVRASLSKKFIKTSGFGFAWFNNLDWRVERLKRGQLVIFSDRDNNFLYYEFVKK